MTPETTAEKAIRKGEAASSWSLPRGGGWPGGAASFTLEAKRLMRNRFFRFGLARHTGAARRFILVSVLASAAACLPGGGPPFNPYMDDAGSPPPTSFGDDASVRDEVDLGDPFAITGLQPSHGPWTGGTRTTIAGRGFSSNIQVWIGGALLGAGDVFASDPTRAAVVTPAGTPGPADVTVRNVLSGQERTLPAGFSYDAFAVTPGTGATTGGTRILLQGSGTTWTSGSTVKVGSSACTDVAVASATSISCSTPANDPGSQDITVTNTDDTVDLARDAFVYADSPDGYRGGLYGSALSGTMKVLVFDADVGTALEGAQAIAGSNIQTAVVGTVDASGVALLTDPSLVGKVTVTVVAKCHQPLTYVDVPVDTVTAYLNPELDPSCASGDPPSSGDFYPQYYGEIDGELVWPSGEEFGRGPWSNVPAAQGPSERQAAYVFTTSGDAAASFSLPAAASATTPASGGTVGYSYAIGAGPGNQTVYALAGIEDRTVTPPLFVPYAMGVVRGVALAPDQQVVGVDIPMSTLFNHALTTAPQPPPAGTHGPDRLVSTLAIGFGASGFAILPQGTTTTLLPVGGDVSFVGIPALDGTLVGADYALTASAVTGAAANVPLSVVTGIETSDSNDTLTIGGFLPIPTLQQPSTGTWGGTHVALGPIAAGTPVDLALINISSGGGLVAWTVVAPGSDLSFDVPDITQVPGVGTLVHGPLTTTFSIASVPDFDYGSLRTGQLESTAWSAYAQDVVTGSY